jgi:CubicO group peptidase (beta-lactamase class C family)
LLLVALATCACAAAQDVSLIAARHYQELIRRGTVTGAAFASVEHGQVTDVAFWGKAGKDSLWRAASTSKAFTAIGIMRLVERGQIELDVNVNRYLKSFRIPAVPEQPITVRHLLTHTSGLDDRFVGSGFLDSAGAQPPLATVMRKWLPQPVYQPGQVYFYSNFGYGVLGALIEDVTGRRFEDYMRSEVLEPLGMWDSTFQQPLPQELRKRVVPPLERTVFGLIRPADLLYHRSTAGGGLTSSFQDLIRFAQFVQNRGLVDGRAVLHAETVDRMLGAEPGQTSAAEGLGFGLGVNRGERYWYSGGDLGGYHTVLLWFPDHGRALLTTAASSSEMATWNLVPKVVEHWFGGETNRNSAPKAIPYSKARERGARVAGTYRPVRYPHFDLGKTFSITMDQVVRANADGSLQYGGERWIAVAPLRFRHETEARYLTFQEDAGGSVRFMDRSRERIAWYQSGRAAIVSYFGFLILSIAVLMIYWSNNRAQPLRWLAWAITIHSVAWLGAALAADPQRLILGLPWYLIGALAFGTVVPLVWIYLAATAVRALVTGAWPMPLRVAAALTAALSALYLPFTLFWQLTLLPVLGIHPW